VPIILADHSYAPQRPSFCKAHQDCFHHQGQEREVLVQELHVALSCTTSGSKQIGRVNIDQKEEELEEE
jgi:hypothetical protein